MELTICCDASVKLPKMTNVMEVNCHIDSYEIKGDTLEGNILINGNYIQDDLEKVYDFRELVPFTIVFKDKNYLVNSINVQNLECQEIINQGIECNFNIVVDYLPQDNQNGEEVEMAEEIKVEETVEEPKEEDLPLEEEQVEVSDEEIKSEINKKYDDLLNEILEAREDENFLEPEKAITFKSDDRCDDCRGLLNSIQNKYAEYKIYYTNKETDIEDVCKREHLSIEKVYKDNQKSDFIQKKRIIIK